MSPPVTHSIKFSKRKRYDNGDLGKYDIWF